MSLLSRLAVSAARAYGMLVAGSSTNVSASYLVVAGGAGGGSTGTGGGAGGGGAGGYLTGTSTLSTLTTYTVTVGAGGNGATTAANGSSGSNSVFNTITSAGGGGGGGGASGSAVSGGSGGGGSNGRSAGSGNTPSTSPSQGNNGGAGAPVSGNFTGGGGGGASAVGVAGTSTVAGNGGAGTASSITGSSVTYAGGGGGGTYNGGTRGSGGSGGGGQGGLGGTGTTPVATAGTANLGGGGGGGGYSITPSVQGSGAAGGSGVVIISYTSATPKFVGGTLTTANAGATQVHTFTSSGTLSPLTPVTASYLVVAGGGGGGAERNGGGAGGGGAGGLLTSSTTLYSGATYVVTVGAGGAGAAAANPANSGTAGSNSVVSGTGLTTLTATGGGFGGAQSTSTVGGNGGSGGGGWSGGASPPYAGGTGTSGQGNNGGSGNTTGNTGGGGGGGASAVGGSWSGSNGSNNGGAGTASSITGTSITYAGGGGGAVGGGAASTGGAGGGGAGGAGTPGPGGSGTTNLGAGGGGGAGNNANPGAGGSGGSGTVIISYAGSQVFNGGLVTSSGGNTIHTFNATGALTPVTNNLNNSLRFRASNSAYLNRTPTVAGNRKTWTWSAWVKRGTLGTTQRLFCAGSTDAVSPYETLVGFNTLDQLLITINGNGATGGSAVTSGVFRDPSAWYHIVAYVDMAASGQGNKARIYVNGNQQTVTYTTLTTTDNTEVNNNVIHRIAANSYALSSYFDGYLTDINFIDGQALEPYYFGNNDAYGNWKPIKYTGMYGTNGFYLKFADASAATAAAIGKDSSGNGNNWTPSGISVTAGVTYDAMLDVPTNTSATVANYAVLNPLNKGASLTISDGNLYADATTTTVATTYSTLRIDTATYWENYISATDGAGYPLTGAGTGISTAGVTGAGSWSVGSDGYTYLNGTSTNAGYTYTSTDIIQCAYDPVTGKFWLGKNNTWFGSGNPATGANPVATIATSNQIYALISHYGNSNSSANFGQRPFTYTAPSGFVALNTYNLPTPTILQGNKYMDATLYTGTNVSNVIVNQGQFKPDLVWIKARSVTGANGLTDSVRGRAFPLFSNSTDPEGTSASDKDLISFNSNGFTVGIGNQYNSNGSGNTLVGWQWQAGQGTNTSNTSGSITSTVSVNTTAGFSVVTYTGTGANATVGHGLGVAPKMIIVKVRSTTNDWAVYHSGLTSAAYRLQLNTTIAQASTPTAWNSTAPTSTVFSLGTLTETNASAATYVAYCWAEIAGFSKFGSYTGNGSTDGVFVYLGFRPKYVMIKCSSAAGNDWPIIDTSRATYNVAGPELYADLSQAESTSNYIDIVSNGFKIRSTGGQVNTSATTYIYAAYAENPFNNSNAR